ncbi:MAG: O-antigen ligase family protein [Bacteroidales bacterium]|nr:O-antigen ligase family protein [Bacteroidales bacterium]
MKIAAIGIPFLFLAVYLALYYPYWYILLLVVLLPLSLNLEDIGMGAGISLPGEVMVMLMALLMIINLLSGYQFSPDILRHPVTIAIGLNLLWMLITSITSTMPVISAKYLVMRIAFILVFYLFIAQILGTVKGITAFFWLYGATLLIVIIYTLLRHAQFNFIQQVNAYVPKPFFKDHTIYGACVAMVLPFFAGRVFMSFKNRLMPGPLALFVLPFLLAGVIFSYSRAVWLSIALIMIGALVLILKIRMKYLIGALLLAVAIGFYYKEPLMYKVKNVQSERGSDIEEHASSIVNIQSSASNKERINRWEAGLDMFFEKPVMGFGPGTYPFQYARFQDKELMTRISTYFGDKGGVHSEYLKPLSESGLPGFISFVAIILLTITRGVKVVYNSKDRSVRILAATIILGLTTYYIHGFFNFFLHTDKAAVLFWGMTAFIVTLDIKYGKDKNISF